MKQDFYKFHRSWETTFMLSSDINAAFNAHSDTRYLCGENHGELNYKFERCFFVASHEEKSLNMSQQIDFCAARKATMVYPRKRNELNHIWKFYKKFMGWSEKPKFSRRFETNFTVFIYLHRLAHGNRSKYS